MSHRVLIIRFSALGDILLTFPSIDFLSQNSEVKEIHYLTKKKFKPIVELNQSVTHVHTISDHAGLSELYSKIKELKALNIDIVFDLHSNLRSRIASFLLKKSTYRVSKYRLKEFFLYFFKRKIFNWLRFKSIDRAQESIAVMKTAIQNSDTFTQKQLKKILLSPQIQARIEKLKKNYICICVESAWKQKQWPFEKFIEVAEQLEQKHIQVVWLGLESIAERVQNKKRDLWVDLTGQLETVDVAQILRNALLLISNDSGLMHLAEAVQTPVLAIFGPTSQELGFAPRLPNSKVIESDLWCRPCSKTGRFCFRVHQRYKCLQDVSSERVIEELKTILKSNRMID